jgi:nitronate monooxygenase
LVISFDDCGDLIKSFFPISVFILENSFAARARASHLSPHPFVSRSKEPCRLQVGGDKGEIEEIMNAIFDRTDAFCARFGLRLPILLAPMAGASAPSLSIAIANAGGLGSCGVLMMQPDEIFAWAREVRANSNGAFQLNTWIPDPLPQRDAAQEQRVREFLAKWGPPVPPEAGDAVPASLEAQCEAMLEIGPPIVSSVMGLYPPHFVTKLKERNIAWFANISTVAEARAAEAAGADVIVAQASEAGGPRGSFDIQAAERQQVGLFSLLPSAVNSVRVPVIATGGIADAHGVAAALALGASAVQIGTGFLRCPEAKIHPAWADALATAAPEDTIVSRVFSGRAGRSLATNYVLAATAADAPQPAPYPVQRGLTAPMRSSAQKEGDVQRMQAWAGQSAALAQAKPAAQLAQSLWNDARAVFS